MNKNLLNFCFFGLLPFFFVIYLFWSLKSDEFLLIHDQLPFISNVAVNKYLSVWNFNNGGNSNILNFIFFYKTAIVYKFLFMVGLSVKWAQIFFFTICISLTLILGYIGFSKIEDNLYKSSTPLRLPRIYLICLLFVFNPFTMIWMNSGGFWSLNFVLSYGILPLLILYTYEVFRHGISSRKQIYSLALVIYILFQNVSFAVMTCIVIVSLFLFFVIIFKFNFLKKIINWNVLFLVILIFFLISDIIYAFTKELVQNSNFKINNTVISSTSFSELGGILNILLGYYTWSIYTSWSPRSLLIFSSYLKNVVSWILLGMFTYMSYVVSISKKYHHFIKYILGIFVISLFFSKGPQPPFGFIFTFLLKTNSLFGAVRSPDNKFSALVILSIIVLIHYFWQVQKTKFLSRNIFIILAVLLIVLNIPILTKEAIIGKNIPNYSGTFIASIGKFNLQKISELIGSNSNVLMYPPIQFNTYISNSRELYIGQDILPNISKSSFIYYDDLIHLDPKYYSSLRRLYDENDFTEIANLDISHILIRKNLYEDSSLIKTYSIFEFERQLQNQQYQIIYNSPEYTLYNINSSFERKEIKTFSSTQNVANIFIFISFFFLIATIFFIAKYKSTVS